MPPSNKRRSRRLRKKLHVGEFKELGFEFEVVLKDTVPPGEEEALADLFLAEIVEPRHLAFGGWITGGFISCWGRGSVTEEDREAIRSWLLARAEIGEARVSPLVDAWYPPCS
jgi:uncharacterized protein YggL (DUF469 family)